MRRIYEGAPYMSAVYRIRSLQRATTSTRERESERYGTAPLTYGAASLTYGAASLTYGAASLSLDTDTDTRARVRHHRLSSAFSPTLLLHLVTSFLVTTPTTRFPASVTTTCLAPSLANAACTLAALVAGHAVS